MERNSVLGQVVTLRKAIVLMYQGKPVKIEAKTICIVFALADEKSMYWLEIKNKEAAPRFKAKLEEIQFSGLGMGR